MMNSLYLWVAFLTLLSTTSALPQAAVAEAAIIAVEAVWGDMYSAPRNKTFAVPLDKVWNHMAFTRLERVYLIASKGYTDVDMIQCQPFWTKASGQGYAGLWLTSRTPTSPHAIAADLRDASLQLRCSVTR